MRSLKLAAFLAMCGVTVPVAFGSTTFTSGQSNYVISFSDLYFTNAKAQYDAVIQGTGNAGDTDPLTGLSIVRTAYSNLSLTASGNFSIDTPIVVNSGFTFDNTLSDVSGGAGGFDLGYQTAFGTDSTSWIVAGVSAGGFATLELFHAGGNGIVQAGSVFTINLTLPGHWNGPGTAPGCYTFTLYSPWSITTNFVYNGTNTIVQATDLNYDGSSSPALDVILYGAAVPEPSALALSGLGLAALGVLVLRRRN
jgi:hypothetical protein